jgi:hypothetical protein
MWDDPVITLIIILGIIFSFSWVINRKDKPHINGGADAYTHKPNREEYAIPNPGVEHANSDTFPNTQDTDDHEKHDLERERDAMVDLTRALVRWTAVLAFATAVGGTFLYAQYRELHQASVDSGELVKTARETEERQLRAYLNIVGEVTLKCLSCKTDPFAPMTPLPKNVMDNTIGFSIQNGGKTPAYGVYVEDSYYWTEYEGRLPQSFAFPIIKGNQHFAGLSSTIERSVGIFNPGETEPDIGPIPQDLIDLVIKAQHHSITIFYYGNIHYSDVFQKDRVTPFCFEYLPDLPENEQFANCAEHNTPPKDG